MTDLPQAAIGDATAALLAYWGNPPWGADEVRGPITAMLHAAAPHIAATECERIRQLAISHEATGVKCAAGVAGRPHAHCATWNPRFPFTDLLTPPEES